MGVTVMPPTRLGYRQIAADLEDRIRCGEYPPGSELPSYSALSRMYSCSVTTAQSAIRVLKDAGLVRGESGVGTFVLDT